MYLSQPAFGGGAGSFGSALGAGFGAWGSAATQSNPFSLGSTLPSNGAFGAQSAFPTQGFGQAPASGSAFGGYSAFGTTPAFSSFGQTSTPGFSLDATGSAFGSGNLFGGSFSAPATQPSFFGSSAPAFGDFNLGNTQPQANAFGSGAAFAPFGSSGAFGSQSAWGTQQPAAPAFGATFAPQIGTKMLNFQPHQFMDKVDNKDTRFQLQSFNLEKPEKSFEELRYEDLTGQPATNEPAPAAAATAGFGAAPFSMGDFSAGFSAPAFNSGGAFGSGSASAFSSGASSFPSLGAPSAWGSGSSFFGNSTGSVWGAPPASGSAGSVPAFSLGGSFAPTASASAWAPNGASSGSSNWSLFGSGSSMPSSAAFPSFSAPATGSGWPSLSGSSAAMPGSTGSSWGADLWPSSGSNSSLGSLNFGSGSSFLAPAGSTPALGGGLFGSGSLWGPPATASSSAYGSSWAFPPLDSSALSMGGMAPMAQPVPEARVDSDPYGLKWMSGSITSSPSASGANNTSITYGLSQADAGYANPPSGGAAGGGGRFRPPAPRSVARMKPRSYGGTPAADTSVYGDGLSPDLLDADVVLVTRRSLRTIKNVRMPEEVPLIDDLDDSLKTNSPLPESASASAWSGGSAGSRPASAKSPADARGGGEPNGRPRATMSPPKSVPQHNGESAAHMNGNGHHHDDVPLQTNRSPIAPQTNHRPPYRQDENDHSLANEDEEENLPVAPPSLQRKGTPFPGNPPTLKQHYEDYDLTPSLNDLRRFSPEELKRVKNFRIASPHGSIMWPGETDVHGLDIDSAVHFEHGVVEVYPDGTPCPPIGQQLNKRAEIRLLNCFPPSLDQLQPQERAAKLDKYERKLIRNTDKIPGAKFLGYDRERGEWHFQVEHFDHSV